MNENQAYAHAPASINHEGFVPSPPTNSFTEYDAVNESVAMPTVQLNRLLRVALINSYLKGKAHTLDLDNNTLITGKNAAGKTSLMHAIVPFYGSALSAVSRKTEVLKSFIKHYLPDDNSYIVYEYMRAGELCCVILRAQHSIGGQSDKHWFNLVSGGYDESLFIGTREDNTQYFKNFEEVRSSIEDAGRFISSNLTHVEYEAIICNTPMNHLKVRGEHQSIKTISRLRGRFSLATSKNATFNGFSGIANNVLNSKLELDDIANFLIAALKSERKLHEDGLVFDTSKSEITTALWVRQRKTWQEIESLKPKFALLADALKSNAVHQSDLATQETLGKAVLSQLNTSITASSTKLLELKSSLNTAQKTALDTKNEWRETEGSLSADINIKAKAAAQLQKQYAEFENGTTHGMAYAPMYKLKDLHNEIPSLIKQKQVHSDSYEFHKQQLDRARFNIDAINSKFNADIQNLEAEYSGKIHRIEKSIDATDLEYAQKSQNAERAFNASLQELKDNHQYQRDQLNAAISEIQVAIATLQAQAASTQYSDAHQKSIDDNAKSLDQVRASQDAAQKRLRIALKEVSDINRDIDSNLTLLQQQKAKIQANHDKISKHRALIQGNTLFSFLLNSESNQGTNTAINNIHKIINPELLACENLAPEWVEDNSVLELDSVYGLTLNTANIQDKEHLTKQEIVQSIDDLDKLNQSIKLQTAITEKTLSKLDKSISAAKTVVVEIELELTKLATDNKMLIDNSSYLLIEAKAERQQRIDAKITEVSKHQTEMAAKKGLLAEADAVIDANIASIRADFDVAMQQQANEKETRKQQLSSDIETTNTAWKQRVDEVTALKNQAMQNEGYDTSVLADLEVAIKEIDKQMLVAETAGRRIEMFKQFLQNDYPELEVINQTKQQLERDLIEQRQQNQKATEELAQFITAITTQITTTGAMVEKLKVDSTRLAEHIAEISKYIARDILPHTAFNTETALISNGDTHLLTESTLRSIQAAIIAAKETTANGLSLINTIKVPFNNNEAMFESLFAEYGYIGMTTPRDWYKHAALFMDYMASDHESKKELIIGQYTTEAEKINNFKHDLDAANKSLKSFAKSINNSCAEICSNLNSLAIKKFELKIKSVIEENYWYKVLNDFSIAYSQWDGSERLTNPLPSENLIAHLEKVQAQIGQNKFNVNFADQFSIQLEVTQRGETAPRIATRSGSIKDLSSNGTIRIAQLIVYLSLIKVITNAPCTELKLFIDEVGVIDPDNTRELLELLADQQVSAMCAAPEVVNDAVIPYFNNNIACSNNEKGVYKLAQTTDLSSLTQVHKMDKGGAFATNDDQA